MVKCKQCSKLCVSLNTANIALHHGWCANPGTFENCFRCLLTVRQSWRSAGLFHSIHAYRDAPILIPLCLWTAFSVKLPCWQRSELLGRLAYSAIAPPYPRSCTCKKFVESSLFCEYESTPRSVTSTGRVLIALPKDNAVGLVHVCRYPHVSN